MHTRRRGLSARLKLTLSYVAFLMVVVCLLLGVVWAFLLRYVPQEASAGDNASFYPGRRDLLNAFTPVIAWTIAILLVISLVGGWILAGKMLAPLQRITETTRKVAAGSYAQRINMPGRQDEFRELADSFDGMLAELEAHVAEQQRFAANASHELRTPLAVTQTMLDAARRMHPTDITELLDRLHASNGRAIALTEALLLLSKADRRGFARSDVDLSLAAEQAAEVLLPLAERNGVDLTIAGDVVHAVGSAPLIEQLVSNLLQNAIVHNVQAQGTVVLRTARMRERAVITVENTGRQLDPATLATLTEPFQRGTSRIHSDQAGVGLGLAIVKSIVLAHDGRITLEAREVGGLSVTVELPLSSR